MNRTPHPSEVIAPAIVAAIRNVAGEAEDLKQLHPRQLDIIHGHNWFRLFVPKQYGGLERSLPEALQLEEALAWIDGSVAWTVTLCAGAGWFIGFLDPDIIPDIFRGDKVCLAGSGKSTGIAKVVEGGFEISGHWDYATGAGIATAFTANCRIEENGVLKAHADGSPVIRSFVFLSNEVTIIENWKMIGMIATGSNSFEVKAVPVKANRSFDIGDAGLFIKQPIYYYPFLQLAETTLAVNSSGMAMRFLELSAEVPGQKAGIITRTEAAIEKLNDFRQAFYATVHDSWKGCAIDTPIPPEQLRRVSDASKKLATASRQMVDELYPLCGMYAASPQTEINRVWRNLHTASQHSLLSGSREID